MDRRVAATAFLVGTASLMYELTQVRMLAFLLGASMDFLAIPLALLGLAIGSMVCHFAWRGSLERLIEVSAQSLFWVMALSLMSVFWVADGLFPEVQAYAGYAAPGQEALRVVVYSAVFLPPYVLFGALLAALFSLHADRVGRLYFFDLAGAGLGCVLAPTTLTLLDLPETLLVVLAVGLGLLLLHPPRRIALVGAATAVFVLMIGLANQRLILREHPDATFLSSAALGHITDEDPEAEVEEVEVRWNEVARTSLVRIVPDGPYAIVQDNGLSNVTLLGWVPRPLAPEKTGHHGLAWRIGLDPRRILVVFAGAGRDMVLFDRLSGQRAEVITGVELNPDVVRIATHPGLASLRLDEFLANPNRRLVNAEGRDFLNRDEQTYDLIHVANNGAVNALRTGHTRKFLDTEQAMEAYLERLAPDGTLVFSNQPVGEKLGAFRRLLPRYTDVRPEDAMVVWGERSRSDIDSLVVRPAGFTAEQLSALEELVAEMELDLLAAPGLEDAAPRVDNLASGARVRSRVTDDKPFTRGLALRQLSVIPSGALSPWQMSTWIKVFTVVLFTGLATGVAAVSVALGGHRARVPAPWAAFLLLSGIGYMAVEIGLIAKTELVLGNPLYSVAINLALFLVFNAIGAALQDRVKAYVTPATLTLGVVLGTAWALGTVVWMSSALLSASLGVKIAGIAVATAPVGAVLGMFYPFCVTRLVATGHERAVPITYGLTTLASVVGSALAMSAIIDLGFTRVIIGGVIAYGLAALMASRAQRPPVPP